MTLVNTGILKQPLNWVTVLLMLIVAGTALHLVLSHYSQMSSD